MRRTYVRAAALISMLGSLLLVPPAHAASDSGRLNCTGKGYITPVISYQPGAGYNLAVKKAGPPSSPTWGVNVRGRGSVEWNTQEARVSPYAEGSWSAYSRGPAMSASASCSRRAATTARAARTVSLGSLSCPGKQVQISGDGYSDIWISWRKTRSGAVHRVKFAGPGRSDSALRINDAFTRDSAVYDIKVSAYRSGLPGSGTPDKWLQGYGKRCA
jgi:hypothetical protein